ncbi:MAG TPA: hypothetical protein VKE27_09935, partial [Candidatus Dormibacteraeota bacterium]|nr:hypothetical protein [Candidatus Dormibacteraeota bacterium]
MKRDEVVTPAPMLERTVTAYVLTDDRDRKVLRLRPRRSRWNFRPMTVAAAALLVVALIGGLILGGRLLRDFQNSPSPAINQGELKRLEARPLVALPAMPADGICPIGPLGSNFMGGPAVGTGEVRLVLGESFTYESDWGTWV